MTDMPPSGAEPQGAEAQQPEAIQAPAPAPTAPSRPPQGDPRDLAIAILTRIDTSDARARESLDDALRQSKLSPEDSGLLTELVYGSLRQRPRLDLVLGRASHRPLESLAPWVRNVLRTAAHQMLNLDRVPDGAAVDRAVELARQNGHEGVAKFVNGVLREVGRMKAEEKLPPLPADPAAALAIECGCPPWMVARLVEDYGFERAAELLRASNQAPPLTVRVNSGRVTREALEAKWQAAGFKPETCRYSPWGLRLTSGDPRRLPGYDNGEFYVQDESGQLLLSLLAPQPGWQVADVCAAPGAKASHLAERVGPQGLVWAFDRKGGALDKMQGSFKRLGLRNVRSEVRDASHPKRELLGRLDGVLVDAPCSGLGVLRRRLEARWQVRPENIEAMAHRQGQILFRSADYLKVGGALVYATCTLDPRENEDVVRAFLDQRPEFAFERAGAFVDPALVTREGYFRAWPGQDGMDGFFAARFRRIR